MQAGVPRLDGRRGAGLPEAKEAEALAALAAAQKQKREPGQLTVNEAVKRMRARCTHDFVRVPPSGPRDNRECHEVCRLCNATRE